MMALQKGTVLLVIYFFSRFSLLGILSLSVIYGCIAYFAGVLEADFIEPAHDKQDFERSSLFVRLETKLNQMVMDYWFVPYHFF